MAGACCLPWRCAARWALAAGPLPWGPSSKHAACGSCAAVEAKSVYGACRGEVRIEMAAPVGQGAAVAHVTAGAIVPYLHQATGNPSAGGPSSMPTHNA
jgi:hypothetical protein